MNASIDVLSVGFCSWDYLGLVPRIPLDDKVRMVGYVEQGGGPAATAAVAASRLGVRTAFAGTVGDDTRGELILDALRSEGVDVSACVQQEHSISAAGFCWIEQSSGRRSIAWDGGTTTQLHRHHVLKRLSGAKVLHLDGEHAEAATAAAREARESGIIVSLDAGTYREHMNDLIEISDVVIASEPFARDLIGRDEPETALGQIAARGPRVAMVTMGCRGMMCASGGRLFRKPAFTVDVVDTTGAGDVFHGAFCVGLVEDWDLEKCIEFASAAAALKCTRLGGRTGIPNRAEVSAFLDLTKER